MERRRTLACFCSVLLLPFITQTTLSAQQQVVGNKVAEPSAGAGLPGVHFVIINSTQGILTELISNHTSDAGSTDALPVYLSHRSVSDINRERFQHIDYMTN